MWQVLTDSPVIDILDVLVVAFLLYRLLLLVRGTRAAQMFIGLGLLVVLSWIAERVDMIVLKQIISSLQTLVPRDRLVAPGTDVKGVLRGRRYVVPPRSPSVWEV